MCICSALIVFTKSNRYKTVIPFFRIPIVLFSFFFCNRREIRSGFLHTLSYIDRCITTHKWQQQFGEIIEPNVLAFNASCLNNWKCNREADKRTVGRTNNLEPESAFELCSPKKKKKTYIYSPVHPMPSPNITCQTQQNRTNSLCHATTTMFVCLCAKSNRGTKSQSNWAWT